MKHIISLLMLSGVLLINNICFAQSFDTLLHYVPTSKNDFYEVHDITAFNDGQFLILYGLNRSLFLYDSHNGGKNTSLEAYTRQQAGDKVTDKNWNQVKVPAIYGNGNYIIAASDLDQDGNGGRFFRWNTANGKMDVIETSDWGIDIFGISKDGRYLINYYAANPGKHLHLIDLSENKTYKIKTRHLLYANNFYFSDDNSYLIATAVLRKRSFKDIAFSIPDFNEEDVSKISYKNPFLEKRTFISSDMRFELDIIDNFLRIIDKSTSVSRAFTDIPALLLSVSPDEEHIFIAVKADSGDLILLKTSPSRLIEVH